MEVNPNIFKAYDIRGIYPEEINGNVAYSIGRAFAEFLNKLSPKIAVGRDGRLSSQILHKNLIKGLMESGANVIDIGLSPTPMFYFAVAYYGFDGGINITASHNPKEYNGFKLVREKAIPIGENSGLAQIKNLAIKGIPAENLKNGGIIKKKVINDYVDFNLEEINIKELRRLKIVIDTANAVSGVIIPKITKKMPVKVEHLFGKLDGNFPNHQPDPLRKENIEALCFEVRKRKADLGVALDGDGDRIIFVDENGAIIRSDIILSLMSELILSNNHGAKILYDLRSSRVVKEVIEENEGVPIIWRVGHSFIKEKMRKDSIVFAGEFSGHFYHQKHYFCEAPLFVMLKIIELISTGKETFSQLIKPYQKYWHSGEINFEVADKLGKIEELKRRFNDGKILGIDGLRVDFNDWWFNVRPSNTEPLLRLVIEAKTKELLEQKTKELTEFIAN